MSAGTRGHGDTRLREGACWQVDTLTGVANGRPGGSVDLRDAGLKGGSIGRPDSQLGNMTEALIPVSGFPLSE